MLSRRLNPVFLLTRLALGLAGLCFAIAVAAAEPVGQVFIDEMTWVELHDQLTSGSRTVLVPIGGVEQSGPHMVLGKHNVRASYLAGLIARRLGHTLVAPVLAYVPEGGISPPTAHMRFTGTLSIPPEVFEGVLEATARSFKQHGFAHVIFLGDHGGYQKNEQQVADKLNRAWATDPRCRVHALTVYYDAAQAPYQALLRARGFTDAEIGRHAGLADTSLMLAVDASGVRPHLLQQDAKTRLAKGVDGDPQKATAELGQLGVQLIVDQSVQAIRALLK
jgi:creatinine amidohydrolase/Fe(II)-dependent formamide hydrolase-like protein